MAIQDRLRNRDLEATILKSRGGETDTRTRTTQTAEDTIYDLTESKRMKLALDEMRSCCQTQKSLESFEKFEAQLTGTKKKSIIELRKMEQDKPLERARDVMQESKVEINSRTRSNAWWAGGSASNQAVSGAKDKTSSLTKANGVKTLIDVPPAKSRLTRSKTTGMLGATTGAMKPGLRGMAPLKRVSPLTY